MPVLLHSKINIASPPTHDSWVSIDTSELYLPPATKIKNLGELREGAFDSIAEAWIELGKAMSKEPSSQFAHTPSCVANTSDFGLMLAWTRLIDDWSVQDKTTLVICRDPWVYRHLASRPGVQAGPPPGYAITKLKMWLRGYAARSKTALTVANYAFLLRWMKSKAETGAATLLVYGHPRSSADGQDGYFGDLMAKIEPIRRVLHVDCPPEKALALATDGKTLSLHAWGNPFYALTLPFKKWRPKFFDLNKTYHWLIRRAAHLEGGSGQAAMIAWQTHCHQRWLQDTRPRAVAWPWENHAWERDFVRRARGLGARTIGYQHSVIGRQMLNYSPGSNFDALDSIPDQVLCTGEATQERLAKWNLPMERMAIGGAFRFPINSGIKHDPDAPVFLALPFDPVVAAEMVAIAQETTKGTPGRQFVVKDHPMTPFKFQATASVQPTDIPLTDQKAVSAVVYAATTVGLEAILLGLPTLRFRPSNCIALDILPADISVPATGRNGFAEALSALKKPNPLNRDQVFASVDTQLWAQLLA